MRHSIGLFIHASFPISSVIIKKERHYVSLQSVAQKRARLLRFSTTLLLLCLSYLLAACGGSTTASTTTTCDKATGFTLYSAQGYDSDVAKAFKQQTGITTNLVDDSTGNLIAKISAEKNNPQWDVAWFDGNVTMQTLDNQGYLLKWDSPNIGNYTSLGTQNIPSDHAYYPTGITAAGAIVYSTQHIPAAGLPQDWNDLTKPVYNGLMAENDPAYSGPAYPFMAGIAQVMGGEDQ